MKKIILIGGSGTIGSILIPELENDYEVYNIDLSFTNRSVNCIRSDAQNYEELIQSIPQDADVLVNLLSIPVSDGLVDIETMNQLVDLFFKASYNILQAAVELGIPKVIFSSSNHVTDYYENNGDSILGRQINANDYPYSKGLYGTIKLAVENIGIAYSNIYDLSVINLRIGTVRENEKEQIYEDIDRFKKTWLSKLDLVNLYRKAIKTDIKSGTFYGVSNNPDKPWSTENTERELGFVSQKNAIDIIDSSNDC